MKPTKKNGAQLNASAVQRSDEVLTSEVAKSAWTGRKRNPQILRAGIERLLRQEIRKARKATDGRELLAAVLASHVVRHIWEGLGPCYFCKVWIAEDWHWHTPVEMPLDIEQLLIVRDEVCRVL